MGSTRNQRGSLSPANEPADEAGSVTKEATFSDAGGVAVAAIFTSCAWSAPNWCSRGA